jgi:hypothetical protein
MNSVIKKAMRVANVIAASLTVERTVGSAAPSKDPVLLLTVAGRILMR